MAEEGKKISFGFSKLKKPTNLVKPVILEKPEKEFVDSFDGSKGIFSYKGNIRSDKTKKEPLVIPLVGTKTAYEVIRAKLESANEEKEIVHVKIEKQSLDQENLQETENKPVNAEQSIEALAAKEILHDLQENNIKDDPSSSMVIAPTDVSKPNFVGEKESTLEDYDNIPVNDFGLAMLRGMGWKPETGIGKDQRVVPTVTPKLRPKGLGLGADKALAKPPVNEDLVIAKNAFVKFVSGIHNGSYGRVEAVDGDTGRVVVKLALGGSIDVSEILLIPVTKNDYEKNSKVLNAVKFEEYKDQGKSSEIKAKGEDNGRKKSREKSAHRKEKYDRDSDRSKEKSKSSHSHKHKHRRSKNRSDSSQSSDNERDQRRRRHKDDKSRSHSRDTKHKKQKKKKRHSSDSD